ncbi:MAG: magnesium/cobalt transporter CorA [Syntrophorhabdaceae bacterium]
MPVLHSRRSSKAGLPPGTLLHLGRHFFEKATLTVVNYNDEIFRMDKTSNVEECFALIDTSMKTWINVDAISDAKTMEAIGEHFGLHPLMLEDIMNTDQRPKMDDYEDYLFVVLKGLLINVESQSLDADQISFVLGRNYIISFLERPSEVFRPVIERLQIDRSRIRKNGPDYLLYSLMDIIVDNYFAIIEKGSDLLEDLEVKLLAGTRTETLNMILKMKKDMIVARKTIWPVREVLSSLDRNESELISPSLLIYFRDIYDHSVHAIDNIENLREMLSGMLDIYLSSISNRLNEVMKVLTIISTIFMPLTFIAGVYGMNFKNMPEIQSQYGYAASLVLMGFVVITLLIFFKRKKWF